MVLLGLGVEAIVSTKEIALSQTPGEDFTETEKKFLIEIAHPALDRTTDTETLKHFAEVW